MCDGRHMTTHGGPCCRLTLFETAGCATGDGGHVARGEAPPHALRNRGMCDGRGGVGAARGADPPHALRNRGMCDRASPHPPESPGSAASRSSKPRDVRRSTSATSCQARTASRSSKPRDVRPPGPRASCGSPSASRSSKPRDVRHVRTHEKLLVDHVRLTLFETAGCATGGRCSPRWRIRPPHALRNRGMCDRRG